MDWLLEKYGESHQNPINKLIHWLCVPSIVLSAFGILYAVPFVVERGLFTNWAFVFYVSALIWYLRLSVPIAVGMAVVCGAMILGVDAIYNAVGRDALSLVKVSVGIFAAAWVVQFIGHKIEGKKPSFLDDLKFLMVGPAWLLHFIYKKIGIRW